MPDVLRHSPLDTGESVLHYEILEELGAGGMGIAYKAFDSNLKRTVALKTLRSTHDSESDEATQRLIREARAAAALSHPNICVIYAIEQVGPLRFIAMEHVQGENLAEVIARGPMAPDRVVGLALQVADALQWAHGRGILHRDIKPSNIMLTEDGQAKVLDFGLAKRLDVPDSALSQTGTALQEPGKLIGTLAYMSPEQVEAEPLDGRSDLFSLGVVLYELCSGTHPFLTDAFVSTMARILGRPAEPLSAVAPRVPQDLERVVMRCLEKRRDDRWPSAEALVRELRRLSSSPLWRPRATRSRPSVAVLPFTNLGDDPSEEYFSDGITSELISRLAQSQELLVIARSSSMRYRDSDAPAAQIGRELGARALVRGSVRLEDGRCRLDVSLLDAETGHDRWSDSYEVPIDRIFDIQDIIVGKIAEALSVERAYDGGAAVPTGDMQAFEAYLRALYAYHKFSNADNLVAIELLQKAVELDPLYAQAHALLASAFLARVERGWEEEPGPWIGRAQEAVAQALRLDASISQAYSARALIAFVQGNSAEAEADVREALGRDPNNDIAHNLLGRIRSFRGEFEGAMAAFHDALRINPYYVWCLNDLAWACWLVGQEQETERTLERVLAISPGDEGARCGKAALRYLAGDHQKALDEARRAQQSNPNYPFLLVLMPPLLAQSGAADEARALCDALLDRGDDARFIGLASRGLVEAIAGDNQGARRALDRALEVRPFYPALNLTYAILYADAGMEEAAGLLTGKAMEEGMRVVEADRWHPLLQEAATSRSTH